MTTPPTLTPNVRIGDPRARKIIGNVLGWAVIALLALGIIDANVPELNLSFWLIRAAAILAGFQSLFQLLITSPNVAQPANPVPPA